MLMLLLLLMLMMLLLFVSAGISSVVHQVQALQLLSLLLPEANRDTLRVNHIIHTHSDQVLFKSSDQHRCEVTEVTGETVRKTKMCLTDVEQVKCSDLLI